MSVAEGVVTSKGAETRSATPGFVVSKINAALGALSCKVVAVTQFDTAPDFAVLQSTGNAGGLTVSKFSENIVTGVPSGKLSARFPRLFEPSDSRIVAVRFDP